MLLPHLIFSLDAEIDRLQRARDLLAFTPPELSFLDPPHVERPVASGLLAPASPPQVPVPPWLAPPAVATPPIVIVKPYRPAVDRKPRRRQVLAPDTALRSSVPTGPVVISAADVRRAQETKTRPAAEPPLTLDWLRPSAEARSVSALLQRLLDIGKSDGQAEQPKSLPLARA